MKTVLMALLLFTSQDQVLQESPPPRIHVDQQDASIQVEGTFYPSHFNRTLGLSNHHFIVWQGGKAAPNALIQAHVSDREILDALLALGGHAGNNITEAAWLRRRDPTTDAPDQTVEGSEIEITITLPEQPPKTVDMFLEDLGGQGFQFRLGGHADLIPKWMSGCVACLQSCPGGRIGNARYTMRQLANGKSTFKTKPLEETDGAPVIITFRLKKH